MSDNSENGCDYNQQNGKPDDICRDYLRNVCKRGKRCKYRHPETAESVDMHKHGDYTFCHDYQNAGCRRPNCKFLHCTREEEDYYKQNNLLPVRLQQAAALGIGMSPTGELPLLKGEVPVCKDNLKGECKRGGKCKFRHLNSTPEFEYEERKTEPRIKTTTYEWFEEDSYDRYENRVMTYNPHSTLKRRRTEINGFSTFESHYSPTTTTSLRPLQPFQLVEEENLMLRRRVEELKKQVSDLSATNEVLLEQNARYRLNKTTTVHAVNTMALNHLSNSLAQQVALNSELASQHVLQQRLAPSQSRLTAQAALNTSVTINPQGIVPVSMGQTNISAVALPTASLQTLQTTMSLAQSLPQNLTLTAQNSSLVSYPVVSQSLRTAVMQSSMSH